MKRKIALLLAVVMVLSMIPMMSFAASGNTETIVKGGVPRVPDDYESTIGDAQNSIIIREDNFEVEASEAKPVNFQLRIDNAKWSKEYTKAGVTGDVYSEVTSRTDKVLDIKITKSISKDSANKYEFELPLYFEVNGEGPVQVTVDPLDSGITGGTFTVANAAGGATITTIDDIATFSERGKLDPIRIEETSMAALGAKTHAAKFRLPSNFEWTGNESDIEVEFINGFTNKVDKNADGSYKYEISDFEGERDLVIEFTLNSPSTSRGAILVKGLQIYATNSAKEGDVEVSVSASKGGDITSETIKVAKYSDFDITVEADGEPVELISGRFEDSLDDEAHELQTLIIEEEVEGALLPNRRTRVDFPSWVKVLGVDVDTTDVETFTIHNIKTGNSDYDEPTTAEVTSKNKIMFGERDRGESYVEFTIDPKDDAEAKVELTFFVSIKADAEGEIEAEVSGRSGAEGTVVLGEARRPVEMEAKGTVNILDIGKKGQSIPDIIVSEIKGEDLMDDSDLIINLSGGAEWNDYTVEVIEGDLEIDKDNLDDNGGNLIIPIKRGDSSTKPSTIRISNATVDVDRTHPDGAVNARVRGTASRKNHYEESELSRSAALNAGYFDQSNVVSVKVGEVLAGGENAVGRDSVSLTIGQIPEGGDAAPYVKNNRTYAPVSVVAQSLGIAKSNIIWNEANRTVTVFGDKTVQMTIGSTTLLVNGTPVVMDAAPEITSSRTFLPIAWLAKALDVEYSWDAATQTVTFY